MARKKAKPEITQEGLQKAKERHIHMRFQLPDGRAAQLVPWLAQGAPPWGAGYARVFIPFTAQERPRHTNFSGGHTQIVRVSKLEPLRGAR